MTSATANGRGPHAADTPTSPRPMTSISRASAAAVELALSQVIELAQRNGLDGTSATLVSTVPAELAGFRQIMEQLLQYLTSGNTPAATALLQQTLGPAFELDQNQIALESATTSVRAALTSYQSIAPAGALEPHMLVDVGKLRAWSEAAEQLAMAFDDIAARAKARASLLDQDRN